MNDEFALCLKFMQVFAKQLISMQTNFVIQSLWMWRHHIRCNVFTFDKCFDTTTNSYYNLSNLLLVAVNSGDDVKIYYLTSHNTLI